jgi:hypothetical protein
MRQNLYPYHPDKTKYETEKPGEKKLGQVFAAGRECRSGERHTDEKPHGVSQPGGEGDRLWLGSKKTSANSRKQRKENEKRGQQCELGCEQPTRSDRSCTPEGASFRQAILLHNPGNQR